MRKLLRLIFCGCGLAASVAPLAAQAPTPADFYDESVIQELYLTIRPADWGTLKRNYLSNDYYQCNFEWKSPKGKSAKLESIGIRSRGRGSRSGDKPNLRLDFNRYEESQQFLGLKSATLKANNQDASMMHERIVMEVFTRMGLPAPREAYAKLYINNEFFGLYNLIETIDKDFLTRNFKENDGYLYEWKPRGEAPGYHFEWLGDSPTNYVYSDSHNFGFDPATHEKDPNPAPLVELVRRINQSSDGDFLRVVSEYLDLREFTTHVAIENVMGEFDGILGDVFGMNNFYFYRFEKKNLHQFLPWDKDGTFSHPQRPILAGVAENALSKRLLAIPEYKNLYLDSLVRAANVIGSAGGWMSQEIDRLYAQVADTARADPNKRCAVNGVDTPCGAAEFEAEVVKIKDYAAQRGDFVVREAIAAGYQGSTGNARLAEGGLVNAGVVIAPGVVGAGSLVSLYGSNLGSGSASATVVPLPTELNKVSVTVNGARAPLIFVSPGQVNFQIPWEIPSGTATIGASVDGIATNTINATISRFGPGIFVAVHGADYSLITPDKPAVEGEVLILFANGLGPVKGTVVTGQGNPTGLQDATTSETASVTIGGKTADVSFSGLVPSALFVGLYQVNVKVPAGAGAAANTPLVLSIGGASTQPLAIATR